MAIGWMAALTKVPWNAVLGNAPAVVDGAKKLWTAVAKNAASAEEETVEPRHELAPEARAVAALDARASSLEGQVADLQREMLSSAVLIKALADQNSQLIQTVDLLRIRIRLMLAAVSALGIAAVACLFLLLAR
jgi:hypothetical protein